MLKELYQQIVADAQRSVAPTKLDLPDGKVLVLAPGLDPQIMDRDWQRFKDEVSSMTSLLDWCNNEEHTELVVKVLSGEILVTASRYKASGYDSARFDLLLSKAYTDLMDWVTRPRASADVVKGLRTALAGTFDDKYLPIFKRIDFSRKNLASSAVSHAGESMGRSIEAKAQSVSGEIPESLVFNLPIYANVKCPFVELRYALDVDATMELIRIAPIGDCIGMALRESTRTIVDDLKSKLPDSLVLECQ